MSVCVARDARGRWCARVLNPRTTGTAWLALEGEDVFAALSLAAFVFEGKARPYPILDVSDWHASTRAGIETARTLDDLIPAPDWIRAAVLKDIRAKRAHA